MILPFSWRHHTSGYKGGRWVTFIPVPLYRQRGRDLRCWVGLHAIKQVSDRDGSWLECSRSGCHFQDSGAGPERLPRTICYFFHKDHHRHYPIGDPTSPWLCDVRCDKCRSQWVIKK